MPEFRRALFEDSYAIATVLCSAWAFAYEGILPKEFLSKMTDVEVRASKIQENWEKVSRNFVLVEDGSIVAFAGLAYQPTLAVDAEISSLYVRPEGSRKGLGRLVVGELAGVLREEGAKSLCIHTLEANKIGRSFYTKIGGVVVQHDVWEGFPAVWYQWSDIGGLIHD